MRKTVTIQDVARAAGTSVSTVSRVLTGSAQVSPDKRTAVEAAIRQLGFRPSHLARSLRTSTTHTISLLIEDIANPFYSAVARGAEDVASRHGYTVLLCNTNDDPSRELAYLRLLRDKHVDGIILGPTGHNVEMIRRLAQRIPVVQVDRRLDDADIAAVLVDNEGGAYRATRALLARGHERIAVFGWDAPITTMVQRLAGYERALREAGSPVDASLVIRVPRHSPALPDVVQGVIESRHPTALFALTNQFGLAALRAIQVMRLRVPAEMALIVFDDLDFFSLASPPVTAVEQPALTMGERAMQFLIERIERAPERLPEVTILPTQLVMRASV